MYTVVSTAIVLSNTFLCYTASGVHLCRCALRSRSSIAALMSRSNVCACSIAPRALPLPVLLLFTLLLLVACTPVVVCTLNCEAVSVVSGVPQARCNGRCNGTV
jgi:hypothetical protein